MPGGEFTDGTLVQKAQAEVTVFEEVAGHGAAVQSSAEEFITRNNGLKTDLQALQGRVQTFISDLGETQKRNGAATQQVDESAQRLSTFGKGNGILEAAATGGRAAHEQYKGNADELKKTTETLDDVYKRLGAVIDLFGEVTVPVQRVESDGQAATDTVTKHATAMQSWIDAGKKQAS
jgi:chromosome segregation ATPase